MNGTTSSEHRLHPLSILFQLIGQLRALLVPAILVIFGARSTGMDWEIWGPVLLVPYTGAAFLRYLTLRYRYDPTEFVIRSGLFVRNERHIPYARIQNIDAVETVLHRLLGVVDVRLQTAAGSEPEAVLSVLPAASVDEMRRQVFARAGREPAAEAAPATGRAAPAAPILALAPRDLLAYGFIENRGMVIIAALAGLLWDVGVLDGIMERLFGEETARRMARTLATEAGLPIGRILLLAATILAVLLFIRVLSMGWALVRLHGFTLTRAGEDLQVRFGLLTRVSATVPLGRVQAVTIREGPWHRLFGRASVRVTTAGGASGEAASVQREWIAPILRRERLPDLLAELMPHLDLVRVDWQPVDPRAFRRRFRAWLVVTALVSLAALPRLGWGTLALAGALAAWSAIIARRQVAHLGWALNNQAVAFKRGWIWRFTTVTPLSRIQAVTRHESPFDRRYRMARVRVDTAGASEAFRVDVPYLAHETAATLHGQLAAAAAETAFRW
jgi:putative membrane protein